MTWRAGGHGGGGDWILHLRGRTATVGIHSRDVGVLDELYALKPGVQQPKRWDENAWLGLRDDAFWLLVTRMPWRV